MIHTYRRVSTQEQHLGPIAQTESIQRWLSQNPGVTQDYFDDGISGGTPLGLRPEGARLLGAVQAGDTVVCSKLDRLFRSVVDAAGTIDAWTKLGVKTVSLAEGFDMGNPYGKAMAQMASVFAELERAMIRQRTRDALAAKKERGEIVGVAPYGWSNVPGTGQVLVNHKEQEVIQIIASCRAAGMKQRLIVDKLNGMGIKTRHGSGWRQNLISEILTRHAGSARQVMVS